MPDAPRLAAPVASPSVLDGNSYDEMPYESHPYPQTHPSRLNVVATLFGMRPAPVTRCRVLELGCASGGNLIPMAEQLPGSEFIGVDLSGRQIADGHRIVQMLGLPNITLKHASILDVDESYGQFDYIICHGVFSWVPDVVREKILDICARQLRPEGVAYISYNTYPGWHLRGLIRDMMRFHALRFQGAQTQVKQARALLDFLAKSTPQDGGAYATLLRSELEMLQSRADPYLYHEHLEAVNDPLYFYQFAEQAARHQLRYLGEARLTTMLAGNFGPDVQKALAVIAPNQIQTEQYLDFVRNRMFRETLLVHEQTRFDWTIRSDSLHGLHLTTRQYFPTKVEDIRSDAAVQFQTKSGLTLTTNNPIMKAAMRVFLDRWPATISFADLEQAVARLVQKSSPITDELALVLLNTYVSSDVLEFYAMPLDPVQRSERPIARPSARARLTAGHPTVANSRHEQVNPADLERNLIPLLDGTRDRSALAEELTTRVLQGQMTVQRDGKQLTDPEAIRQAIAIALDQSLQTLEQISLLVG
jgi:methyltransferase-like protein/2-polyprenyl-3-methyl-5-hydroxy-6-metoxy-1,4-benzoquinol methylase